MQSHFTADVPGFPGYIVRNDGAVFSRRSGTLKPMHPCVGARGYPVVCLTDPTGRTLTRPVHRLVLEAFSSGSRPGYVVRHIDGNPLNNCLANLRWGTYFDIAQDRERHGCRTPRGERNRHARLTEADVLTIRQLRAAGLTLATVGARFGLDRSTVSKIVRGKRWAHVPDQVAA